MIDQPKKPASIGVVTTAQAEQLKRQAQAQVAPKTQDQLLREAIAREHYNKGKHDANWQKLFTGAGFAYLSMIIAFVFIGAYGMWNDNDERAKRFLTAREIEHMKLIEGDAHPVMQPNGK